MTGKSKATDGALDETGFDAAKRGYELGMAHSHVECLESAIRAYLAALPSQSSELLSLRRKVEEAEAERDEAEHYRSEWERVCGDWKQAASDATTRADAAERKVEEQRRALEVCRDSVITGCDTISTLAVIARALAGDRP